MALRLAARGVAALGRPQQTRRQLSAAGEAVVTRAEWQRRVARGPQLQQFLAAAEGEQASEQASEQADADQSLARIQRLLRDVKRAEQLEPDAPLVDRFGRRHSYLRISLSERCNLRCRYCMPAEGVSLQPHDALLSSEEIVQIARVFAQAGVDRIRLTGGEPLLRRDLVDLVAALRGISGIESVGITTNGLLLSRHIKALQQAGVDRVNVSLDTLQPDKFAHITRRAAGGFQRVVDAISLAEELGFAPLKVNCVVMRHFNRDEIVDFVEWTRHRFVDVRFIEWMPFDSNRWNDETFVPFREMMELIAERFPDVEKLQDGPNDTSKAYHIPGFRGQFGFITSMSEHFCGTCNRLRLTADGNLKVCLFGNTEVSLRDALRLGLPADDLQTIIRAAVRRKKKALGGHGDMYGISKAKNRPMILIGG